MILGCNTDPGRYRDDLAGHAAELKAAGFTMARFPLRIYDAPLYMPFCRRLRDVQMDALPVFVAESIGPEGPQASIRYWKRELPADVYWWQIGNEADHDGPSSWTMTPAKFSALLRAARRELGQDRYLIAGGMVSGHPDYLDTVDLSRVNAIAVHPYAKSPEEAAQLIREYQRFGKPIWVTEFGYTDADIPDPLGRAWYYATMAAKLAPLCEGVLPFSWHDQEGFGIAGTWIPEAIQAALHGPRVVNGVNLQRGGLGMKLEDVAANYGGFYAPPIVLAGTVKNPKARIAWVNDTPNGFVLEIGGEAANAVYAPLPAAPHL